MLLNSCPSVSLRDSGLVSLTSLCAHSLQSCPILYDPVDCQAPLPMGFSRQKCWSGLPCPSSEDLPDSGIEPASSQAPALQVDSSTTEPRGKMEHDQSESDDMTAEQKGKKKRGEDGYSIYSKALTHLS